MKLKAGAIVEKLMVLMIGLFLGLSINTGVALNSLRTVSGAFRRGLRDPTRISSLLRDDKTVATYDSASGPRSRKDIVLCLAEGKEYQGAAGLRWLGRFAGSFRRYNQDAELIFFTTGVDETISGKLDAVGIKAEIFGDEPPPWNGMEVAARRWYLMRHYLERRRDLEGGWVLAIDARDSFFQGDPFAFPQAPGDELYVFLEGSADADTVQSTESSKLRVNDWNRNVIAACYNLTEIETALEGPVSCSGTVMGSYAAMVSYMRLMEGEMLRTANDPVCNSTGGRDQGFHNVLLHSKAIAREMKVTMFNNRDGALVHTTGDGLAWVDFLGRVLNMRGEVPAIIHQWDRVDHLFRIIDNKLFPVFEGDVFYEAPDGLRPKRSRVDMQRYVLERASNGSAVR